MELKDSMGPIHLGLSQETVFQDLKNSCDGADRQSSESHSVEPGLGCWPLFISRKALVANIASISYQAYHCLLKVCYSPWCMNLMMSHVSLFRVCVLCFFHFVLFYW